MSSFTAIDLSRLPAPAVVEQLDYETIFAAWRADLLARHPEFSALTEAEPAYKIMQAGAYRELTIRQQFNDRARAVLLAYAVGADLDQIAAGYNVVRLVLDPGDPLAIPPREPVLEPDVDLRRRVQLAFEGFSTAGPDGAYLFHALGAHADVLDVSVTSPTPGAVQVSVLSRSGNGAPAAAVLTAVNTVLSADDVRPLTDQVTVQAAVIVDYTVTAELTLWAGPDSSVVLATAQTGLDDYIARQQRLGHNITRSGLFATLHVEGVQNVTLIAPAADLVIAPEQAGYCIARTVTVVGTDE